MGKWYYLRRMKVKEPTQSVRIDKDVVKDIKRFIIDNGGSIRSVLEHGAIWAMTKGAKEYIQKLNK